MKLCIECRFYGGLVGLGETCVRDSTLAQEASRRIRPTISPVDGKEKRSPIVPIRADFTALDYRLSGECGMDAKFFEPNKNAPDPSRTA